MSTHTTRFDFGDTTEPVHEFTLFEKIITDRGSVYSVSVGKVTSREDIKRFLTKLKRNKKYAKATHNSWAAVLTKDGIQYETKNDDGEVGAGLVILRSITAARVHNVVVCVTRWFGGTKLMGDRFRHVKDATVYALERIEKHPPS